VEYSSCGDDMNRLRETRLKRGLTQVELSKLANISQREISFIENDLKPEFSLKVAKRLAKALNVTVDYLWPGDWPD
jgi:DNA-binding XRE family transcriptional regulator